MMEIKKIFSWQDVERILLLNQKKWKEFASHVEVFKSHMEVILRAPEKKESFLETMKLIFLGKADTEQECIYLEGQERKITICFDEEELSVHEKEKKEFPAKPLFKTMVYRDSIDRKLKPIDSMEDVPVIVFHSYKGGVGRTLSLLAFAKAWISENLGGKSQLLIVDSDIEAPGLTWLQEEEAEQHFSYLDFLEMIQNQEIEQRMEWIKEQVEMSTIHISTEQYDTEQYFIPTYRYEEQLMDIYATPENIVSYEKLRNSIPEQLSKLGEKLGVSAVLVDLRAGFSEYSAPFLFDLRVKKYLVSSTSAQSVRGIEMILTQVLKGCQEEEQIPLPELLLTMIPETLSRAEVKNIISKFQMCYDNYRKEESTQAENIITEIAFSENLVHLSSMESIMNALKGSNMLQRMVEIVKQNFKKEEHYIEEEERKRVVKNIHEYAHNQITAEGGAAIQVLVTRAINNLVKKYKNEIPCTVILGAKGSGKTFLYREMLRQGTWEGFCEQIGKSVKKDTEIYFLPVLCNKNAIAFQELLDLCMQRIRQVLPMAKGREQDLFENEFRVETYFKEKHSRQESMIFWENLMAEILGGSGCTIEQLDIMLKEADKKIVFLFDGLEEILQENEMDKKVAVSSLCQEVIRDISFKCTNIGSIVFMRKDLARESITTNYEQFIQVYGQMELNWSKTEALRLVLWTVQQAYPGFLKEKLEIENAMMDVITQKLNRLWGAKLGKSSSNEANTSRWVLAALSDFNGQLQARDVMRFLEYATEKAGSPTYPDRYLMPKEIRSALPECSRKKIAELKDEMIVLRPIFDKLEKSKQKVLPFMEPISELTSSEEKVLMQEGYLIIDDGKYYLPEIIRHALGYKYAKGARPKVLSLIRDDA